MDPVAEHNESAAVRELVVEQYVAVAKDEEVDGLEGVFGLILLGESYEGFLVGAGEDGNLGRKVA